MPEVFRSIGKMWPSMSRVECRSEFELQDAFLQSEILFLGAFLLHGRREKRRSAPDPGTKADVMPPSRRSRPDIVSFSFRRGAWHCQPVPPIIVDLLRREERLFLEEHDQCNIDSFTSAPWGEHWTSVAPVYSTSRFALFSDC
jgi:hypothetical protein